MSQQNRQERLAEDLEVLRALKKVSTIFDFEYWGDPPDRYTLIFRGRGVCRDTSARGDVEFVDVHRCDMRLPYSYPNRPPDIRWLTPLFHPNVSFSGFINLRDIGLTWDKGLTLTAVCQRLWDVARLSHLDLDRATNYSAKSWFADQDQLRLPLDHRPLEDKSAPASSNVIRYERRDRRVVLPDAERGTDDVMFIGENTPTPVLPERQQPGRSRGSDDDVLYIGYD